MFKLFLFFLITLFLSSLNFPVGLAQNRPVGAVFSLTNELTGNRVASYPRYANGSIGSPTLYPTGGVGSGLSSYAYPLGPQDALGSQHGLILSSTNNRLYVVNALSNTVTSFVVNSDGTLALWAIYDSGGEFPVSLALSPNNKYLYVLNVGGFGRLASIDVARTVRRPGAQTAVSYALINQSNPTFPVNVITAPGDVIVSPDGKWVLVSEKLASNVKAFRVNPVTGRFYPTNEFPPVIYDNNANGFGFSWPFSFPNPTTLLLGAAGGPDVFHNATVIQSFQWNPVTGGLVPISVVSAPNGFAGCWFAQYQSIVYYSINIADFLFAVTVDSNGQITPVNVTGLPLGHVTPNVNYTPIDIAATPDGFFYLIGNPNNSGFVVCGFQINPSNGNLTQINCNSEAAIVQGCAAF